MNWPAAKAQREVGSEGVRSEGVVLVVERWRCGRGGSCSSKLGGAGFGFGVSVGSFGFS